MSEQNTLLGKLVQCSAMSACLLVVPFWKADIKIVWRNFSLSEIGKLHIMQEDGDLWKIGTCCSRWFFMYFSTIPPIENAFEFECSVIVCVRSRLGTSYTSSILCYPRRHRVYFHCNAGFFYLTRMYCPYWENSSHFEWKLEDHSLCRTSVHAQSRDMQNTRMGYNFHKKSFFA